MVVPRSAVLVALALCAMLIAGCCGNSSDVTPSGDLKAALDAIRTKHNQPAVVAAVVQSEGIRLAYASGVCRWGEPREVSIHSRFHVGSCTKSMTAVLVGRCVERTLLRWDSTIAEVLPDIAVAIRPEYRSVTVRQLLGHRAGISPFTQPTAEEMALLEGLPTDPTEARRAFAVRVMSVAPLSTPGTKFEYSNAGTSMAGLMAETVTGSSWKTLMRETLFGRLGLGNAGFGLPAVTIGPQEPWGHRRAQETDPPLPEAGDAIPIPPVLEPCGDTHCSIVDLAAYVQMHLQGLRGRHTILAADTVRYLHTAVPGEPDPSWAAHGATGYACGWVKCDVSSWTKTAHPAPLPASWHNGSAGSFLAYMTIVPDHDVAYVCVTNCGDGDATAKEITGALLDAYPGD